MPSAEVIPQQTELVLPATRESATVALLRVITEAARDPNVDAAKMRELWNLKRDIDAREAEIEFNRAMQAVQSEIQPIMRDAKGQNNRYARLEAIDRKLRPIYTRHGFSLMFGAKAVEGQPDMLSITCECLHRDGHVKHYELPSKLDSTNKAKSDIQAVGATVTYLRRYLTSLIFGLVFTDDPDDNDGTTAYIDEHQRNQILDLLIDCRDTWPDIERLFLKFMGVSRVEEIPAQQFELAVNQLQAKAKAAEKQRKGR